MENISDIPKRGRPGLVSASARRGLAQIYSDVKSARRLANKVHLSAAFSAIDGRPGFEWLHEPAAHKIRSTIMSELGRFEDPDMIRKAAAVLCTHKPATGKAVALIRQWRKVQRPVTALDLHRQLVATINAYMAGHAGMTWAAVLDALVTTEKQIRKAAGE